MPKGTALLLDDQTTPADQVQLAKVFLKYVDPLLYGLKNGGIVRGDAGLLNASNQARGRYAYFETEFMTSVTANSQVRYNFEDMILLPYLTRTAVQIVNAMVEQLENRQTDLNAIRLHGDFRDGTTVLW
jgi:hypothetical protein